MAYNFNADEIFEMAKQLERNGAKFYRDAADTVAQDEEKAFLLELAAMEDDHEKTFSALQKELKASDKKETVFDPDEETCLYLMALADTKVFYKKEDPGTDMREILKSAITAEKDSIVFYLGMKGFVPEKLGKNRLDSIIKEEMGHIRILAAKLKSLSN